MYYPFSKTQEGMNFKSVFPLVAVMVWHSVSFAFPVYTPLGNIVQNGDFRSNWLHWSGNIVGALGRWPTVPNDHALLARDAHQFLSTVPGQRYALSFYAAADLFLGPSVSFAVALDDTLVLSVTTPPYPYNPQVNRYEQVHWQQVTYSFVATDSATKLEFIDLNTEYFGLAAVSVVAVPATPPTILCSPPLTLECTNGTAVGTLYAEVSDTNGNPLEVVWTINGVPYQTNNVPSGGSLTVSNVSLTAAFVSGVHEVSVSVSNGQTNAVTCSTTVTVGDASPPKITRLTATPQTLWPPNHRMVPVTLTVHATDNCDPSPAVRITQVKSNERQNRSRPDWEITGPLSVNLRAERLGNGKGRTYTIVVESRDASGNVSSASVNVTVRHDRK